MASAHSLYSNEHSSAAAIWPSGAFCTRLCSASATTCLLSAGGFRRPSACIVDCFCAVAKVSGNTPFLVLLTLTAGGDGGVLAGDCYSMNEGHLVQWREPTAKRRWCARATPVVWCRSPTATRRRMASSSFRRASMPRFPPLQTAEMCVLPGQSPAGTVKCMRGRGILAPMHRGEVGMM